MIIRDYTDMEVKLLWHTPEPKKVLKLACGTTMLNDPEYGGEVNARLIKYLIEADHTKVFEHICMGLQVTGISRSLLQQNITHRHWSCTSSSQHYQDYSEMPLVCDRAAWPITEFERATASSFVYYNRAISTFEIAKEEARQVLPSACMVNQVITTNYRNLITFFKLRLCYRNVLEMQVFADVLRTTCMEQFPEFMSVIGPQCFMDRCRQGKMKCRTEKWIPGNLL